MKVSTFFLNTLKLSHHNILNANIFIRLLLVAFFLQPFPVSSHEIRPAIVDLNISPTSYSLNIRLNLEAILAKIGPEHVDTNDSVNAEMYNTLREMTSEKLASVFAENQHDFLQNISILDAENNKIAHNVISIEIPSVGNNALARDSQITLIPLTADIKSPITWSWPEQYGANIIRVNQSDIDADESYSAYLAGGEKSAPISLVDNIKLTVLEVIKNYIKIGFTHILPKGVDHILFVVGLFLLSARLRPLLIQITCFTLAHTITLALGTIGILAISPSIVEPLIAASIVYVCIENIFSERLQKWRPFIVFGFGLLHGLGFAGVLSEVGISSRFFITALLSFNIGVELGQLVVIFSCFLSIGIWCRNYSWYRKLITIPASLVIALIGGVWFFQRIFG